MNAHDRIARIRHRYQTGPAVISVERARLYTESWQSTEGSGMPRSVRIAEAMRHVYRHMTHYVDADDRIAGHWTEGFLGVPVDIERGVFNSVLESELEKGTMVRRRAKSAFKGLVYLMRRRSLLDFLRHQKVAKATGTPPMDAGLKTMSEREINPFQIASADRRLLLDELLPYWRGRSLVDALAAELDTAGLYSTEMQDFVTALSGNTSRQVLMLSTCATIATLQGHVIIDHERVVRTGLRAMREEAAAARRAAGDKDKAATYESIEIALDGVIVFAERLAERIAAELDVCTDSARCDELDEMLAICRRVPLEPATTFREAVQALWTTKTAVEVAHPVNLHCFGRLDQILIPYYRADLESARITPDAACELLEELLLKVMSQNVRPESNLLANFYQRFLGSSPVTLGGVRADGRDGTNELTYLFLEAAHRSKAVTNVSVRIGADTPDTLLERVAEYLQSGTSNISLFADEVNIEAMRRRGFAEEDARDFAVMGCVEATCPGKTGSMSANALLLSQLLDITLRDGCAPTMAGVIRGDGLSTGDPDGFADFDALLDAFFKQARHAIEKIVAGSNLRDRLYAELLPAPHISAFMDGCLQSGRDVTSGGATYDLAGISMINSVANLVDSLLVIKTLVFDEHRLKVSDLIAAVDDNFEGHDEIARAVDSVAGKWGNADPETDALAHRVCRELFADTYNHTTFKGGPFVVYLISVTTHTIGGRMAGASPDGRRAATPYAASANPYNVERHGVTSALRSVASLPYEDVMGCAVNVKFHPTGIGATPEARRKWAQLVRTYFAIGGSQIQPTVASREMLLEAQRDPGSHRDLIVKVGGYSTYFVDLGREIQDEIIARTEHE